MFRGGQAILPGIKRRGGGALLVSGEIVSANSPTKLKGNPFNSTLIAERNANYNKSTVGNHSIKRSTDMREELLNQRILTSLKLDSANMKTPIVWKQKQEAYLRYKDMKNGFS